jgi:group I intron endonuclease
MGEYIMPNSVNEQLERISYIYRATNLLDGTSYIGQSVNPIERIKTHFRNKKDDYFHNALMKYGSQNFEWHILLYGPESAVNDVEIGCIVLEDTKIPFGYNMTDGGEGTSGFKHRLGRPCSDATKQKIRESKLGKKRGPPSDETKRKISETLMGKKHSEDSIKKQKKSIKLFWENISEEDKSKRKQSRKPYVLSEKSRQRLINSNKSRIWSEESKQKLIDANLGKKKTKKQTI